MTSNKKTPMPTKLTGSIWNKQSGRRNAIINIVCKRLKRSYGKPRLGNPKDPIDDLVYIIISNKTTPKLAQKVYLDLKRKYGNWKLASKATVRDLYNIIKPSGLGKIRSRQLKRIFTQIACDRHLRGLHELRQYTSREAEKYLMSLPGVSKKVAKCVMMYTLGFKVLPVDIHTYRISKRLGFVDRGRADQCHEELEMLIPPPLRHDYHVDCVMHGRLICRPKKPKCGYCCIKQYCAW